MTRGKGRISRLAGVPAAVLVAMVRVYQLTLSGFLGGQCRFVPSCSNYFIEAVRARGAVRGGLLGLGRLWRCHPLSRGGYDPVPEGAGSAPGTPAKSKTHGKPPVGVRPPRRTERGAGGIGEDHAG